MALEPLRKSGALEAALAELVPGPRGNFWGRCCCKWRFFFFFVFVSPFFLLFFFLFFFWEWGENQKPFLLLWLYVFLGEGKQKEENHFVLGGRAKSGTPRTSMLFWILKGSRQDNRKSILWGVSKGKRKENRDPFFRGVPISILRRTPIWAILGSLKVVPGVHGANQESWLLSVIPKEIPCEVTK